MTALKAHLVADFLDRPDLTNGVFLAYGPDQGLVGETARRLMTIFAGKDADPMSEIIFDASELVSDPSRLAVEARTISMFGGTRRIRVRSAGKALTTTLSELLDSLPDVAIVLEAGNLPPRDALRSLIEKHKSARALPCYPDNDRTLNEVIRKTMSEAGIEISADLISLIRENLGNDREITRRELEKLTLFAQESKTLTAKDITTLCGDNGALVIDEIIDAAGAGRAQQLDSALNRAFDGGIEVQRILIMALRHFTWLRRLRTEVDNGRNARDVLDKSRPRPHFSRKTVLEQQLRIWNDETLASASNRIYQAIAETRLSATMDQSIAHRALLAISVAAAHY